MNAVLTLSGRVLLAGPCERLIGLTTFLTNQAWPYTEVNSPREVLRILREEPATSLVLLVPGESLEPYLEVCRSIKFDSRSRFVPVIFLLGPAHDARREDMFDAGADDSIRTGAPHRELLLRLAKAARAKQATDSLEDSHAVVMALANAVEGKDHYTCGHVERVGAYCLEIGRRLNIDAESLAALRIGGVVHDIGKIGIPDHILNKPGALTDEERLIMQRHPAIGYDILKPLRTFRSALPIVRWHHERPNGSGYPDGLKGADLPLLPRIAAVADVFDALVTDRPYRKAFPLERCKEMLSESAAKGDLDGDVVRILFEILSTGSLLSQAA